MRRLAAGILALLVILGIVGVVADRIAHAQAERSVLVTLSEHAAPDPGTEVVIEGFPFLTQLAAGRLAEVHVTSPGLTVEGVALTDVRAAVRGVSTGSPHVAETVEINAEVPLRSVRAVIADAVPLIGDAIDLDIVDGRIRFGVAAAGVELAGELTPVLVDGGIGLELDDVSGDPGGGADAIVRDTLDQLLGDLRLEIPGLPEGLVATRLEVLDDGLGLRLEGTDITLEED